MSDINDAAKEHYAIHGFSTESVKLLDKRIRKEKSLLDEAVYQAAYDALRGVQHTIRHTMTTGKVGTVKSYDGEMGEVLDTRLKGLYAWPMMNGVMLADATKEDLDGDATKYQANADGNALRARFLRLVRSGMGRHKKVRNAYTPEALGRLMDLAKIPEERRAETGT